MQKSVKNHLWIYICISIGYQTVAAPLEYDIIESDREISYDFDTEQSQARYDPRVLSEELKDKHSSSQERAAACLTSNIKYEHGEKVKRSDPCEVCLCVDGEIFCWWKKCDHSKRKKEMRRNKQQKISQNHKKLSTNWKKSQSKLKKMKKIFSFPQHLPATLHFDLDMNENKPNSHLDVKKPSVSSSSPSVSLSSDFFDERRTTEIKSTSGPFTFDYAFDKNAEYNANQAATITAKGHDGINKDQADGNIHNNQYPNEEIEINVGKASELKVTEMNDQNNSLEAIELQSNSPKKKPILNSDSNVTISNKNNEDHNINSHPDGIILNDVVDDVNDDKRSRIKASDIIQTGKIQFVDVPLAKHYIITSSGSIENGDILASENVLSQFRNGYSIVNVDSIVNAPQADDNVSVALEKKSSTSINDTMESVILREASGPVSTAIDRTTLATQANPTDVTAIVSTDDASYSLASSLEPSSLSSSTSSHGQQRSSVSSLQSDTTEAPSRQECVVMGVKYKIGTILPQDTGNCLQCICIEGANSGDSSRVTCSPHNCPPLVLPDLFDTTGY